MGKCQSLNNNNKNVEINTKDEEFQEIEKIMKIMDEDISERKKLIESQYKIEKGKINEILIEKMNNEKELKEKLNNLKKELEELINEYNNCQLYENLIGFYIVENHLCFLYYFL